jgi:MinD superfamily P-loop ATPase
MKQLTILSGKGGTGKTTITASLAVLARNAVLADCDVDAPDLHMLLHPEVIKTQEFKGSKLAVIDKTKCDNCGFCREKCRFDAITGAIEVDPIACEGCGVCAAICPADAITMTERVSGYAYISNMVSWRMPCLVQAKQIQENWSRWSDRTLGYYPKKRTAT